MAIPFVSKTSKSTLPLRLFTKDTFEKFRKGAKPKAACVWMEAAGFKGQAKKVVLCPTAKGDPDYFACGIGDFSDLYDFSYLPQSLPEGTYYIDTALSHTQAVNLCLGWALACYDFNRYKAPSPDTDKKYAKLVWPKGVSKADQRFIQSVFEATTLVRDLINTPAQDLGPAQLAAAARKVAKTYKAKYTCVTGKNLLKKNFPSVHAVGRASSKEPRLIEFTWGNPKHPKIALVGKGVCFDTGGINIKPAGNMRLMKKDMGGAAHVLGLAQMIMQAKLKVHLHVLIPAVENSIAGNAMLPMDVIKTRSGKTIEIGHTDAEGRVILADALVKACEAQPEFMIDCATLTGAARVALGTELPAMFAMYKKTADKMMQAADKMNDPIWPLPLYAPYAEKVSGMTADLTNSPANSQYGGAITAALFLKEFVNPGMDWVHFDMMAWNTVTSAGKPKGGEAQGMRTMFEFLRQKYS